MTFNDFYFKPAYLVDSMHNKTHCPYVVTAHIRYTDFVNDYNCSGYPVLTSMIRDPANKLRSEFYFRRYLCLLCLSHCFFQYHLFFRGPYGQKYFYETTLQQIPKEEREAAIAEHERWVDLDFNDCVINTRPECKMASDSTLVRFFR